MTTVPNFPALPTTKDISGADIAIPLTGDADYRASIGRARGDKIFSVTDYGATGDGSTDDRTAFQACIDAASTANTDLSTVYVPKGIYRITASASVGLSIPYRVNMVGEGGGLSASGASASVILFDTSDATGARLFELKNVTSPTIHTDFHYYNSFHDITFKSNNPTIVNQHCFQFGDGTAIANAHHWTMKNCAFINFSGACFRFVHVTGTAVCWGFSYSSFSDLLFDNIGGIFDQTALVLDGIIGTNMTWLNTRVSNGGWNETSPIARLFDFFGFREVNMYNTVIEGAGPTSNPQTSFFRYDGHGWLNLDGLHLEQVNDWPDQVFETTIQIDSVQVRTIRVRGCNNLLLFDQIKLAKLSDYSTLILDDCSLQQSDFPDTLDLIDDSAASLGAWHVSLRDCALRDGFFINPRHIGRVVLNGCSTGAFHTSIQSNETPLLSYSAARDGWLCGLVSDPTVTAFYGSKKAFTFFDNGPVFSEIGLVIDDDEGRVFAYRADTGGPNHIVRFDLPAENWGTGAGEQGAQIYYAVRWKFQHEEVSDPTLQWNSDGGDTNNETRFNGVTVADRDTWYSTVISMVLDGAGTEVTGVTSGTTPTNRYEMRYSALEAGFGGGAPLHSGSGGFTSATANQMRRLRWLGELPTWGDYINGDLVDNIAPSVGSPLGWLCTTAGALATAWAPATAYEKGDWVKNDTPDRIYICTVAGTSAGSGGPTGTGTGIIDNTVTWDFHDTEAVFTALANV